MAQVLAVRRVAAAVCASSTRCLSTMATAATATTRTTTTSRPNLVLNHNKKKQRRDYEAVLLEQEASLITDNRRAQVYDNYNAASQAQQAVAPKRTYDSDMIVVLDMDECLIHSQFMSRHDVAAKWAHQVARRNSDSSSLFQGEVHPLGRVDSFQIALPDGDLVRVHKRPYLEDFLQQVTDRYETHVFTAAVDVYASPVLDTLDPHGTRFAKRWYRESCTLDPETGALVKNLSQLPLPPSRQHRTVLVDNNPLSFLANPENGILVSNFYDDPSDNTLTHVLELLHELNDMDDVRPELIKRFRLQEALQDMLKKNPETKKETKH